MKLVRTLTATAATAALAVTMQAAPAQADTPASVHFYGNCRSWAVLYTTTDQAAAPQPVEVQAFKQYGRWIIPIGAAHRGTLQPNATGGVISGFRRDGVARVVTVEIAGGAKVGGVTRTHTYFCGSRG